MPHPPRAGLFLATLGGLVAAGLLPLSSANAGPGEVTVYVASGRQFRGQIDRQSGPRTLVLRSGGPGITLWRPIAWERIVAVQTDGKPLPVAALREAVLAGQARGIEEPRATSSAPSSSLPTGSEAAPPSPQSVSPQRQVLGPVTQIAFDAWVANWDADVEADGLLVELMPRAADGTIVPVSGTVEVELLGLQRRVFSQAPHSGGDSLELIERWTRHVRPEETGSAGIVLQLPFGAIHPELHPDWLAWWYGLVHVRLSVPGQGVFDASRDGVRLRPWAPVRDRLERGGAGRMLPTERLGRKN